MLHQHILLIDDDQSVCTLVKIILELENNWQVTTVYSGNEGLNQAITHHPDLILLDVNLPDIDGLETLNKLKLNSNTQSIPVIFFTAESEIFIQQKKQNLAVKGIITKPFETEKLARQIKFIFNS